MKHVEGTAQYSKYEASQAAKNRGRPSVLYVDEATAQQIINALAGTGTPKVTNAGKVDNCEFADWPEVVGAYFKDGVPHETRRVMIKYGKRGSHIVPVEVQK